MTELQAAQQFLTVTLKSNLNLAALPIAFPDIPQDIQEQDNAATPEREDLPAIRCELMTSVDQVSGSRDEGDRFGHVGAVELDFLVIAMVEGNNYPFDLQGAIQSALGAASSSVGGWDIISFRKATRTLPPSGDSGRPIREAGGQYHLVIRPA